MSELLKLQAAADAPVPTSNLVATTLATANGNVHVVRIRRPKVLNALNRETYEELQAAVERLKWDDDAVGMVISGFGNKAFVSGADIHALAAVQTPDAGYAIAKVAHDLASAIEASEKPIVAALNGLAFGGGLELAMACHARVAAEKLKGLAALPEVNLGIIPAGGGTQRLPRLIGVEKAAVLLRTGATVTSAEALACGLVQELVPANDVVACAAERAATMANVTTPWQRLTQTPIADAGLQLAAVDIGHRSRKVDDLLCESVVFGATHDLAAGLEHELEVFRRICELQDMRIGVDHFVKVGPRVPAPFVHA